MKLYIITGASRGLGAALAEALIDPQHRLICMARSKTPLAALRKRAKARGCAVVALDIDIGDAEAAVAALEGALAKVDPARFEVVCLINNAGVVEPIHGVEKLLPVDIATAVAVNLTAPIALTAAFLSLTGTWPAERKILNISSGAAHKPYSGWSVYCATKAALNHFTRCLSFEQQGQPNAAKVVALAPGMIDTAMQEAVRRATPEEFSELPRFIALKASGQLPTPQDAAQRVLRYLERADFGAVPVDDVRKA
ncbi:MAG: SDR family NAD(P)-dependent oxidoreductase [Proteobacteria bacterium]|nr:SDR family NAD(P)-dependent oxidoreductase [Pseudomonadota bacterium]